MTWRVLVSAPYMQPVLDRFEDFFREHGIEVVVPPVEERLDEHELLDWLDGIDGVICGDDRFTEQVLEEAAPRLRVISKWGTGIDSIDQEAADRLGIRVCNTPDAFTDPVSDTVLGYVLAFARRLPWLDRLMSEGGWKKLSGASLDDLTLGVIGVGNIGRAVIRRARPFGVELLGNDIREIPSDFVAETDLEVVSKEKLLERSDFVSLNCDLNPTSRHLITFDELSRMKESAVLVNTARGPLVDEPELIRALRKGEIAGAALDVFETEPLSQDSPLRTMDEVMTAPHNANTSPEAWERVHENTLENLVQALNDEAEAVKNS